MKAYIAAFGIYIAIAGWCYASRVIEGRRLRRQYEEVFACPVPIGRTDAELCRILHWRRFDRRRALRLSHQRLTPTSPGRGYPRD